tara:strand:+ start:883 stop:1800 length:918 start_codon:yes stop_codon:yes gene_type:complete
MKKKILLTDYFLNNYLKIYKEKFIVDCLWKLKKIDYNSYDGLLIAGGFNANKKFLSNFKSIKIISVFGVGYDGVDLKYCSSNKIIVTNTPNILTNDVADLALGLLISLSRKIYQAHNFTKNKKWGKKQFQLTHTLSNKTVGIVGYGQIGKAFAKRVKSLSMTVVYYGPNKKNNKLKYYKSLKKMANDVDYLVLTCIGGSSTKNLISADIINSMKQSASIINVSRGSVINENALLKAIINKKIKGAAIDVFNNEPKIDKRFYNLDNVLLSPHNGSATKETRLNMAKLSKNNLVNFFMNKKPLYKVV